MLRQSLRHTRHARPKCEEVVKNVADSSFQSLPIVDREQATLTLVRVVAGVDLLLRAIVVAGASLAGLSGVVFAAAISLPLVTAVIAWSQLRGPLLAAYGLLAVCVAIATMIGPVASLLAAVVFWVSYLAGLQATD